MRLPIVPVLAVASIVSSGQGRPASAAVRLPSAALVQAYVRDNWPDYASRINRAGTPADAPVALVAVKEVACRDVRGTPDCQFSVTVRLADGRERDQSLSSSFDWTSDGGIEEVIVLRHMKKT
jgi:hypothetical protein